MRHTSGKFRILIAFYKLMKKIFAAVALFTFWLSQGVLAQVRCEALFVTTQDLGEYGLNAEIMAPYYISMFRDTQRVAGIKSTSGLLTKDIFNASSKEFATVVTRFKARNNSPTTDTLFKNQVSENINFVLNSYSERRDWSPELRKHLKEEADHYAEQSAYIEVRRLDEDTFTPHDLIGTMKIVMVGTDTPITRLPLEADFSVTMPANGGRKFEPGNFVVNKALNKIGTSEIFTHLIMHAQEQIKNSHHEPNKMMYYTPADRLGVKMYAKLGFTVVPGFEAPIKEGTKDWWMIGATAETLANLPKRLAENKDQWEPENVEWISQLVKNFDGLKGSKTEIEGMRTKTLKLSKGSVKEMGVFTTEPFSYKGASYRRLSILSFDGGEIEINLRIPEKDFPLKNGWQFNDGKIHLLYKDGVFKLYDTLFKTSVQIKTDGAFKKPEYLWFKDRRNEFNAIF